MRGNNEADCGASLYISQLSVPQGRTAGAFCCVTTAAGTESRQHAIEHACDAPPRQPLREPPHQCLHRVTHSRHHRHRVSDPTPQLRL